VTGVPPPRRAVVVSDFRVRVQCLGGLIADGYRGGRGGRCGGEAGRRGGGGAASTADGARGGRAVEAIT
jgi:hypothetical protein